MANISSFKVIGINKEIEDRLRERVRALFDKGVISYFIGYRGGTLPWLPRPFIAKRPNEADLLVWNSFLALNLANYAPQALREYLSGKDGDNGAKIGIVATGCWSRNIELLIKENQIDRDQFYIIGISSRGMLSRNALFSMFKDNGYPEEIIEYDHDIEFIFSDKSIKKVNRWELVRANCKSCAVPDPVIYDEMIGSLQGKRSISEPFNEIAFIEEMDADGRWQWFKTAFKDCIRCYACRNACPLCYCPTCFVDDSRPQWLGKSIEPEDTLMFHLLRAFHCAGRCTDCGSCEAVCPKGIPMRLLTKKLIKDANELFDNLDLGVYSPNDPDF